jgi:phospholipid N-methyltransferase
LKKRSLRQAKGASNLLGNAPTRRDQVLLFARNFLKHPKMLGSVIPSSRFLIDELLGQIDWSWPRVIVEYGPGVGSFTTEILRRMGPDGKLIVFEMNSDFVELLRRSYTDPRIEIVHGSAGEIDDVLRARGLEGADYIISGIPFSTMAPEVRQEILEKTHRALTPRGSFLVYQFSGEVKQHLEKLFSAVEQDFELLNILPARLFYCRK